jgi:hypothetical protein
MDSNCLKTKLIKDDIELSSSNLDKKIVDNPKNRAENDKKEGYKWDFVICVPFLNFLK